MLNWMQEGNQIRFLQGNHLHSSVECDLRVIVPYTSNEAARAALRSAATLGGGLRVAADLVGVQIVPFQLPLEPDTQTAFLTEQLARIAADSHIPVTPSVVLARSTNEALDRLFPQSSLMVIAARRRWFSKEWTLARRLKRAGYKVVVTHV